MTSRRLIIPFGPHNLGIGQIFFETALSRAFVNIKPITPGHVLVTPKRVVDRMKLLTSEELLDLFSSVQTVSKVIESHYHADALNIAVQVSFIVIRSYIYIYTYSVTVDRLDNI